MNAGELITAVRRQLDDTVGSSSTTYWSESDLYRYANAARDRLFLIVRKFIIDSTTTTDSGSLPLCRVTLVVGTGTYNLSRKILGVTRVKLALQNQPLPVMTVAELDASYGNWQALPVGDPWACCTDHASDTITLVPAPKAIDTVSLSVYRMPLARLTSDEPDADLDFREEYHEDLIPWMLHLAFRKQDSEIYNPNLAEEYRRTFLDRAGDIKMEMHRHVSPPHGTLMRRGFGTR